MCIPQTTIRWVLLLAALEAAQLTIPFCLCAQGQPPSITSQFSSSVVYEKDRTYVTATVTGDDPKQYQWLYNGTSLPGETNFAVFFRSLDLANAGTYSLIVSNALGSTSATIVALDVQPFRHNKMIGWSVDASALQRGYLNFDLEDVVDFTSLSALTKDGTIYVWEQSVYLNPDGTYPWQNRSYFTPPTDLSNVTQLAYVPFNVTPICMWALQRDGTVIGWNVETKVTLAVSDVVSVAADQTFDKVVLLKRDGTVTTWDGTAFQDVVGMSNIVMVSVKSGGIVGLRNDGSVVAPDSELPPGLTKMIAISPGDVSVGLRADHTVVAWSGNAFVAIPPSVTNALEVSSWQGHCAAVFSDGSIEVWGAGITNQTPVVTNAFALRAGWADLALLALPYDTNGIHILSQMYNQNAIVGGSTALTVDAQSFTPIHYQWTFAGAVVDGATNFSLPLQNIQVSDAGTYTVNMSNDFGSTLSADVNLGVFPAQSYVIDFKSGQSGIEPPGLSNIVGIAAGYHGTSAALKSDGTLVEWGYVEGSDVPTNTPGPAFATNLAAIRAGFSSFIGLRKDGTVIGWGNYGELRPPAGLHHVTAIDAFGDVAMARKSDGSVVLWGQTADFNISAPIKNMTTVRVGFADMFAFRSLATIDSFGIPHIYGDFPTAPDGLTNIIDIALDPRESALGFALHSDGTLTCWGQDCGFTPPANLVHVYPRFALDRQGNLFSWHFGDAYPYLVLTGVVDFSHASSHAVALTTNLLIPGLGISKADTNIIASWQSSQSWILESKNNLSETTPWLPVTDGSITYDRGPTTSVQVPATSQRYFRLRLE